MASISLQTDEAAAASAAVAIRACDGAGAAPRRRRLLRLAAAAALALGALASPAAHAQAWPAKPIHLVVPFAPGGPTDASARIVAKSLETRLGQPVIVDNRAGAGGTVGPVSVMRAPADGYTLLWAGTSSMAMGPALYRNLAYDPVKSFTPISMVVRSPELLVGRADLPPNSLKDLLRLAKSEPGKLTFGSAGAGSSTHLAGELFKSTFGIDLVHVGYKGGAPALTDLLGKQIDLEFDTVPTLAPHVKSGALKAYAITGFKRSPLLPDVPTVQEATGVDFDAYSWFGLAAPVGTPPEVVQRLAAELRVALSDKETHDGLVGAGFEVMGTSGEAFGEAIASELKKWTAVVQKNNITVN
jgi:tripartite-type tricarboxylate transporter receptor subunit TctC